MTGSTTLTPVASLSVLTTLNAGANQIADISALSGLASLRSLSLNGNRVDGLAPLSGLSGLTTLSLASNRITDVSALSGLTNVRALYLGSNSITDVASLAGLTQLTTLDLSANPGLRSVAPLSGETLLANLDISQTGVADVTPLSGLTGLTVLGCYGARIADVTPMSSLVNLTRLDLGENRVTTITPLAGLPHLTLLGLQYNYLDITDGSPAMTVIASLTAGGTHVDYQPQNAPGPRLAVGPAAYDFGEVLVGGSAGTTITIANTGIQDMNLTGVDIAPGSAWMSMADTPAVPAVIAPGDSLDVRVVFAPGVVCTSSGGLVVTSDAPESPITVPLSGAGWTTVVTIPDPHLEAAVRSTLGKPAGLITDGDMAGLTHLYAESQGIVDLTGLQYAVNMTGLDLAWNQVVDLAPLSALPQLTNLQLYGNQIVDLAPLSGLSGLTTLVVGGNQISDITPLSGLSGLTSLDVSYNFLDISPGSAAMDAIAALTAGGTDVNYLPQFRPHLSVPALVDFGTVKQGTSALRTVTISNTGGSDMHVSGLALAAPAGMSMPTTPSLPATIAPDASLDVQVLYTPAQVGAVNATLTVTSDADNSPAEVALTAVAATYAHLSATPPVQDFGPILAGTSKVATVTVTNVGGSDTTVTALAVLDGATGMSMPATPTLPAPLVAGDSMDVAVRFEPPTVGAVSTTLTVTSGAENDPLQVPLLGAGATAPHLGVSPPSHDFGVVKTGSSAVTTVTISNTGGLTMSVADLAFTDATAGVSLAATPALPATVAAGGSMDVAVRFSPSATGTVATTLTVTSDADNSPGTVSFTGTGVTPARLSVTPSSHDFGTVRTGSSSSTTITIANIGESDMRLSGLAFTGPAAGMSMPATPALPATVVAGGSMDVRVTFSPSATGTVSGGLVVTSDADNSPVTVGLSGTGAAPHLAVSPPSHDFGTVKVHASVTTTVTITNDGGWAMSLTDLAFTDAAPGMSMPATPALPATVAAGESLLVRVAFSPSATGTVATTLTVTSDADNSPGASALTGTGAAPEYSAIEGMTRYDTAVAASKAAFPASDSAPAVVLCTGAAFPDALSAAALAGSVHGPVLLTLTDSLPSAVADEIARVREASATAYIVGGTGAVSTSVEASLAALVGGPSHVVRVAGTDRYDTAGKVAGKVKQLVGAVPRVFVASGADFADALSVSPAAYALRAPIILTRQAALPMPSRTALLAMGASSAVIAGGTGAVSEAVRAEVAGIIPDTARIAGIDRYDTCVRVTEWSVTQGMSNSVVSVATGRDYPDALAGGAMTGRLGGVMLLTDPNQLPPVVATYLGTLSSGWPHVYYLGGTAAVSTAVRDEIAAILQ